MKRPIEAETRMNWGDLVELAEDQRRLIELLQCQLTRALEAVARLHGERNPLMPTSEWPKERGDYDY